MSSFLKICIFAFIFGAKIGWAAIVKTETLEGIQKYTNLANTETLVLFDVDKVLIVPTEDFIFEDPIRWAEFELLVKKYPGSQINTIVDDYFKKRTVKMLDLKMIGLLQELEHKNIAVSALTQWQIGQFGSISKMEEIRFKELAQVGLSFAKSSPFKDQENFSGFELGKSPMIKSGVILTGSADKGVTLKAVLKNHPPSFKKIIFVDDRLDNLQTVEKACLELGLEFCGIHYTAADLLPVPQFNKVKEKRRFQILETERLWLTDQDLDQRKT